MSYYKILGLTREPFSTSPDPDFLYMSRGHELALTNTLIELNLKRGLNIILGDVGTGKTTLSRKLVQELSRRDKFLFQMILNPVFEDEKQFMLCLARNFNLPVEYSDGRNMLLEMRDMLEKFLLQKTLQDNKTVLLIIDEAQKLSVESLEMLRILLNYETNEFKLIQIVLLGQLELYPKIADIGNFYDRINFKFTLYPFRLRQAGYNAKMHLFLGDAIREIFEYSGGYPRRITILCHKALKSLITRKKYIVDGSLIRDIIQEEERAGWGRRKKILQQSSNYLT